MKSSLPLPLPFPLPSSSSAGLFVPVAPASCASACAASSSLLSLSPFARIEAAEHAMTRSTPPASAFALTLRSFSLAFANFLKPKLSSSTEAKAEEAEGSLTAASASEPSSLSEDSSSCQLLHFH
eukprot:TRINITY_DN5087_c0_g1_i1.p1 TRINITY_DN5087_c0_g1~~TRINITY_DN5087_c0_g1_i1.p1  ORF type:complete len:125 (+),score=21.71 TRINITY_DN5087_c0_g1_i1:315-689(+)